MSRVLCLLFVSLLPAAAQESETVTSNVLFTVTEAGELDAQEVDPSGKGRAAVIDTQLQLASQIGAFEGGGTCVVGKVFRVNSEWINNGKPVVNIAAALKTLTRGVLIGNTIDQTSDGIVSTGERFAGQFRIQMTSCGAFQFFVTISADRAPSQGALEIQSYQLVASTDVSPTVTEYHYRVALKNIGTATIPTVVGTPTTPNPNHQILTPTVSWGALAPGATVLSTTLLKIRMPRQSGNNPTPLNWTFVSGSGVPPTARPGSNQTVNLGATVTLNGSGSSDPNGLPLTYAWSITSKPAGSGATLSSTTAVMPTFLADRVGTYSVQLIVNNGAQNSAPAVVTISTQAVAPTANAGPDQTINLTAASVTVTLNGSASTSPGGLPLTYAWTLASRPTGSTAEITGPTTAAPTFIADKIGAYRISLIVNNGYFASAADEVVISTNNVAPTAHAGPDQSATVGSLVQLTGAGSTDGNSLALTYSWAFSSRPTGSTAVLNNPAIVNPTFTMDKAGSYVVQLIVNNGYRNSIADTVMISTNVLPPVANAGPDQLLNVGAAANLTGAASTDPNGLPLTYAWSLINRPAGSAAVLTAATSVATAFTIDRAGAYVAQLIVNNGTLASPDDTVTLSTINVPPVANAGADQNVTAGNLATLSGALSTGTSGYPLTYLWSLTSKPAGSTATLTNPTAQNPSLTADVTGPYIVQLIVNDNVQNSAPDTVQINASAAPALSLAPSTTNLLTFGTVTATVTLNAPAPSGGVLVALASSNTSAATVPASVTVPSGSTGANFTITGGSAAGPSTITATAVGYINATQTVNTGLRTMTVTGPGSNVAADSTGSGAIALAEPAPAGGVVITIASANASTYTITPPSVSIPAGATTASFSIQGVSPGTAAATASAPGFGAATASITVVAKPVAHAGPDQSVINGATVQLTSAGSNDPGGAALTYAWTLTAKPAGSAAALSNATAANPIFVADITGVYIAQLVVNNGPNNSDPDTVQITSTPPPTLTLSPSPVNLLTFATATGTVTLGAPAPAAGLTVTLASSNAAAATVPASISLAAGATTATFTITAGNTAGASTITAIAPSYTNGTQTVNTALRTMTATAPTPNILVGATGSGTVTLADPAPAGGTTLTLASGNTSTFTLSAPAVTVAAGATSASFTVQGVAAGTATFTASAPGYSNATASITIVAKPIANAGPDQTVINGATVQVTGSGSSDPGGATLTYAWILTSKPAGSAAALSNATAANPTFVADITGVYTAQLIVNNGANNSDPGAVRIISAPPPTLTLSLSPANLLTFATSTGTVTLGAPAPAAGLTVTLASSNAAAATVPASISLAAGATTATYTITAGANAGAAAITASAPAYTNGTQTVNTALRSMTATAPAPNVLMTQSGSGSITIADPAPAGGVNISLAPANPGIFTVTTPVVNIAAGATTASFTVQGIAAGTANLTASAPGFANATAAVTVISKPTANAGPDQTLFALYTVQLNGAGSSDPANGALTYAWTLLTKPAGSSAALSSATAVNPTFVPDVYGTYVAQLIVNNGAFSSEPDTVQIVASPYTITLTPPSSNVLTFDPIAATVTLNTNAPPGGFTVNLVSDNAGIAAVPSSVTIPAGSATAAFTIAAGAQAGTATITGSAPNVTNTPTQTVTTTLRAFTIAGIGQLIHTGNTANGTIALANPAPANGAVISFTSDNPALVSTPAAPITIPSGATAGAFPFTGTGRGFTMLNATAPGYVNTSTEQGATPDRVILPQNFLISVDQTQTYPIRVDQPALRGGYVVTLTNPNPAIGTVTPSVVTIPEGALIPPVQPTFTALAFGVTNITASSPGLTPDTQAATVKIKANWGPPTSERIVVGNSKTVTLSLTAPAPNGNLVINLVSSNPSVATVPATVTVLAGQNQVDVVINGLVNGAANITASAPNVDPGILPVTVAPPLTISSQTNMPVGFNHQIVHGVSISEPAPPGGVTLTITSNDPNLLIAPDGNTVGSSTLTRTIGAGATGASFYLQALASSGTATFTLTSPNYQSATSTVLFRNSGFYFRNTGVSGLSPSLASTITLGANQPYIAVAAARLATNGTAEALGYLRPGAPNVVAFSSSDTAVATVPASLTLTFDFGAQGSLASFIATSVGAGVTNLLIGHPAGYVVPNPQLDKHVLTVNAPQFIVGQAITVGYNLQTAVSFSLPAPPPAGGLPVTITSDNPNLLLSSSATTVGSASILVNIPVGSQSATFRVQGTASSGTATLTYSAPGYANKTLTVHLVPSGFSFANGFAGNYGTGSPGQNFALGASGYVEIFTVALTPTGLVPQELIARGSITVNLASSNPAVAPIPASVTLTFGGVSYYGRANFTTAAPGVTNFTVDHPSGYTVPPAPYEKHVVTVPAPTLSVTIPSSIGYNHQSPGDFRISTTLPADAVLAAISSDNPNLLISASGATTGSSSITIGNAAGTNAAKAFYLQATGSSGSANVTVSIPGFAPVVRTVTLLRSTFAVYNSLIPAFETSYTLAAGTSVTRTIVPATLSAGGAPINPAALRPGAPDVVGLTSSAPAVATVTSSVIAGGAVTFSGVNGGVANITLTLPPGYDTPTAPYDKVVVNVTIPTLAATGGDVGKDLQMAGRVSLHAPAPAGGLIMTLTTNSPSMLLSTSRTAAGSNSISITVPAGASLSPTYYIQSLDATGNGTYTVAAPGYQTTNPLVNFAPSGFAFNQTSYAISSSGSAAVVSYRLGPTTLNVSIEQELRGGFGPVTVDLTNTNPAAATVPASVTLSGAQSSVSFTITKVAPGVTVLNTGVPVGFSPPSNNRPVTVTVN